MPGLVIVLIILLIFTAAGVGGSLFYLANEQKKYVAGAFADSTADKASHTSKFNDDGSPNQSTFDQSGNYTDFDGETLGPDDPDYVPTELDFDETNFDSDPNINLKVPSVPTGPPVDGVWSEWTGWKLIEGDPKKCSTKYTLKKFRKCQGVRNGGLPCEGDSTITEIRDARKCPSTWSKWALRENSCTACAYKYGKEIEGRWRPGVSIIERKCIGDYCNGEAIGYIDSKEHECAKSKVFCSYLIVGDVLHDAEKLVSAGSKFALMFKNGQMLKLPLPNTQPMDKENSWKVPKNKYPTPEKVVMSFETGGLFVRDTANNTVIRADEFTGGEKLELKDDGLLTATDSQGNVVWTSVDFPKIGAPPEPSDLQMAAAIMSMIPGLHMIPGMEWWPNAGEALMWTVGAGESIGTFFEDDVGGFFEDDLGGFFEDDVGGFFEDDVGGFFEDDVGDFFEDDVGDFFEDDFANFFEDDFDNFFKEDVADILNPVNWF
jgi:hypothetical protein